MISALLSRFIILSFGTLYPAYASYKAVRTKNVKEYVKWMMYWIVYAFFTCIETFTDIFLSWFPFYYEVKVIIVLWLLSPATKGSSTLYRKFVHPMLTRREQEIDEYLNQAKERGYSAVLQLGTKGVNYATNVIMQTALKGGGNLVQTLRRSYSLSDLSEPDVQRTQDEIDEVVQMRSQQRLLRPRPQASIARSASGTRHSTGMYFSEVDVAKGADGFNYNIRSSEDISSGYSSAEPVSVGLSRTSSMTNASKTRLKARRTTEILNEPEHKFRPRAQEFRGSLEDFEALHDPTVVDIQKCIQILEEMPHVDGDEESGDDGECLSLGKMQTIDEINDVECSFEIETDVKEIIKLKDQPTADGVAVTQQQLEAELDSVEETNEAPIADIDEVALKDDYYFKEDNNSIYSNSDTYNTLESSDEDNESDVFADALLTLEEAEEVKAEKDVEETHADNFEQQEITTACAQTDLPIKEATEIVNQAVAQATTTGVEPQATTEKPKINAKELQDTLKAIKDNFRANIATTTTIPTSSSYTTAIDSKLVMPRPLTHNKGKAPAPPLPPRPTRPADVVSSTPALNSSVDAASLSSRSPSPAPHRNIFRNIKSNLLRLASNNSLTGKANEASAEKPTTRYETQL
ncbi:uncharacterized protein LOC126757157 isoform X1 [Bactrocera neohumeralis]|nr:uncharacterized protein LOC126757157 isoform X1 [Bactrocera neohumeralis]XP_050326775.1 uncharacterized protein LOC126757157 isoform X1 [Bactrocera neohumeralis]